MADNRAGWLTVHEVLDLTEIPYQRLMELVEEGQLTTESSGTVELFDPDDVALLTAGATAD
jgi:hypothetical protein